MTTELQTTDETRTGAGWLDATAHPFHPVLTSHYEAIRDELQAVIAQRVWMLWGDGDYTPTFTKMGAEEIHKRIRGGQTRVEEGARPSWRLFGLMLEGRRIEENCARCPQTAAALAEIPNLINAGFSCLEAGYHIPAHVGHDPRLYRGHLGLVIPEGDCALRVSGETRRWAPGEMLMFDDTHTHEAWNHTDAHRFVLIVDVASGRPAASPGGDGTG